MHANKHFRASEKISNGDGCTAIGEKRLPEGRVTNMIALLEAPQRLLPSTFLKVVGIDLLHHICRRS